MNTGDVRLVGALQFATLASGYQADSGSTVPLLHLIGISNGTDVMPVGPAAALPVSVVGAAPATVLQGGGPWSVSWSGQAVQATQGGAWTVSLTPGTTVALATGTTVSLAPSTTVQLAAGATVQLAAGATVSLAAGSTVQVQGGNTAPVLTRSPSIRSFAPLGTAGATGLAVSCAAIGAADITAADGSKFRAVFAAGTTLLRVVATSVVGVVSGTTPALGIVDAKATIES